MSGVSPIYNPDEMRRFKEALDPHLKKPEPFVLKPWRSAIYGKKKKRVL